MYRHTSPCATTCKKMHVRQSPPHPHIMQAMPTLPYFPARAVRPEIFDSVRLRPGQDPQDGKRVLVPCLYVLLLEGGWMYIGISSDVVSRLSQHWAGAGSTLTRRHMPVLCHQIVYNCNKHDEDMCVRFFCQHGPGPALVRGGRWCDPSVKPPFPRIVPP